MNLISLLLYSRLSCIITQKKHSFCYCHSFHFASIYLNFQIDIISLGSIAFITEIFVFVFWFCFSNIYIFLNYRPSIYSGLSVSVIVKEKNHITLHYITILYILL